MLCFNRQVASNQISLESIGLSLKFKVLDYLEVNERLPMQTDEFLIKFAAVLGGRDEARALVISLLLCKLSIRRLNPQSGFNAKISIMQFEINI
jgi:hypothetical protein